jgi:mycothiol system anti-sigma-R factor
MECKDVRALVDEALDGELTPEQQRAIDAHLASCADCAADFAAERAFRSALKRETTYHRAPARLRRSLAASLAAMADETPDAEPSTVAPPDIARPAIVTLTPTGRTRSAAPRPRQWLAIAASFAVGVIAASSASWILDERDAGSQAAQEIIADHVRSLMADHLTDVASSDQHSVKPWFNGKLDFSPPVSDFTQQGFPLVGGRLDYVGGHPVAALVYRRRLHDINLFVAPVGTVPAFPPANLSQQGYNLRYWREGGMDYWAVSDLGASELEAFERLVRDDASPKNPA